MAQLRPANDGSPSDASTSVPPAPSSSPTPLEDADDDRPSHARPRSSSRPELGEPTVTPIDPTRTPPHLASKALLDDLAPIEPARNAARRWCVGMGLAFMAYGALPALHLRPGGLNAGLPSLVLGGVALVAGLSPVTYRLRALSMVVLGLLSGILGLAGMGKMLATAAGGLGWSLARLIPAIVLSAALLFRARYRAYAGARVFLAIALASSAPFVAHAIMSLLHGFAWAEVGTIVALIAIFSSLTGFMGAETIGAGPFLAYGTVVVFAVEMMLHALFGRHAPRTAFGILDVVMAASAFGGASMLAGLGLFQIAAWRFAADAAQRIDIHSGRAEPTKERESGDSWSTRD